MRVMIKYARFGSARYLSHLDMQRAFARIFRRSGLPVSFSAGFNPHIQMSFASPLSVGYETDGDYMEVKVDRYIQPKEIYLALCDVLNNNIKVLLVGEIDDKCRKLMSLNASAEYEIVFNHDVEYDWHHFLESESFVTEDRKGRMIELKDYVFSGNAEKNILYVRLCNSGEKSLNPAVVAGIFDRDEDSYRVKRLECFAKTECGEKPFYMLAKDSFESS